MKRSVVSGRWSVVGTSGGTGSASVGVLGAPRHRQSQWHPIPDPQSPIPARNGIILLEVLIAIFVLLFGLLAVAILIIVGSLSLGTVEKSERTAACGHAALHDVKIRRMLDPTTWNPAPTTGVFVLDPLGVRKGLDPFVDRGGTTGNNNDTVQRVNFSWVTSDAIAEQVFRSHDDLIFILPEDSASKVAPGGTRPRLLVQDSSAPPRVGAYPALGSEPALVTPVTPQYEGVTSWFLTVSPANSPQRVYTASVVVCYQRVIENEQTISAASVPTISFGGGMVSFAGNIDLRGANWILLCSNKLVLPADQRQATWYRIVNVGYDATANETRLHLVGPDWKGNGTAPNLFVPTAVIVDGVSGVYTSTIQLN